MLFPTHLVAAYVVGRRWRLAPSWVVLGAALPDVVDKPLAAVGVTDLYHTVGHSALTVLALGLAWVVVRRATAGRVTDWTIVAVAVGWGSHLFLDALHVLVNGRPEATASLLWPVTSPPDPLGLGPVPFLIRYLWTPSFFLELVLWAVAAWVVLRSKVAGDAVRGRGLFR